MHAEDVAGSSDEGEVLGSDARKFELAPGGRGSCCWITGDDEIFFRTGVVGVVGVDRGVDGSDDGPFMSVVSFTTIFFVFLIHVIRINKEGFGVDVVAG